MTVKISVTAKCITAGAFKIKELIDNFPWTFTKEQLILRLHIKMNFQSKLRKLDQLKSKKYDQEYGSNITAYEKLLNSKRG